MYIYLSIIYTKYVRPKRQRFVQEEYCAHAVQEKDQTQMKNQILILLPRNSPAYAMRR